MAVTYIRSVRGDPARTISYAADPEKTRGEKELVTGINCIPDLAQQQFAQTALWWGKEDGVRCYHLYQSFSSGEILPEEANRIGTELVTRLWGDRFEAVVATHCNTDTVHNHIVINAVSYRDGRKFENSRGTYPMIREESDRICREHGLSVVTEPRGRRENWKERQAEKRGLPTVRGTVRNDIDAAVASSRTWNDFLRFLRERGYEFSPPEEDSASGKGPGLRPRGASGYFRYENLGADYAPDEIRERILSDIEYVPQRGRKTARHKIWAGAKTKALVKRLRKYETEILRFLIDADVPFTNNRSERDLRMIKVKLKVSGCFRSLRVAQAFCRI